MNGFALQNNVLTCKNINRYHDIAISDIAISHEFSAKIYNTKENRFLIPLSLKKSCFFSCYLFVINSIYILLKKKAKKAPGVEDLGKNTSDIAISDIAISCYHTIKNGKEEWL